MSIEIKKIILNAFRGMFLVSILGLLMPLINPYLPVFLQPYFFSDPSTALAAVLGLCAVCTVFTSLIKAIVMQSSNLKVHKRRILCALCAIFVLSIWGIKWSLAHLSNPDKTTFLGVGVNLPANASLFVVILISFFCIRYVKKIEPNLEPLVDETTEDSLSENPLDPQAKVQDAKADA